MMNVQRREGESSTALIYRFTKKAQQSGIVREARKRRFRSRPESKIQRRASALHRVTKKAEFIRAKKLGILPER